MYMELETRNSIMEILEGLKIHMQARETRIAKMSHSVDNMIAATDRIIEVCSRKSAYESPEIPIMVEAPSAFPLPELIENVSAVNDEKLPVFECPNVDDDSEENHLGDISQVAQSSLSLATESLSKLHYGKKDIQIKWVQRSRCADFHIQPVEKVRLLMIESAKRDTVVRNWLQVDEETGDQLKVSDIEKNPTAVITCSLVELQGWPPPTSFFNGKYDMPLQIIFATVKHYVVIKPLGASVIPCGMILLNNVCWLGNSTRKQKVFLKFQFSLEPLHGMVSSTFLLFAGDFIRHGVFMARWHPYIAYQQLFFQSQSDVVLWKYICDCSLIDFSSQYGFENGGFAEALYIAFVSKMCTVLENCWPFSRTHSICFSGIQVCKYSVSKVVLQFPCGSALYEGSVAKNAKLVYTQEIALSSELLAASKAYVCYILGESPRPTNYMVVGDLNMVSGMFYGQVLQRSVSKKWFEEMKHGPLGYYFIVVTWGVNIEKASVNVVHRFIVALLTHTPWKSFLAQKHNRNVRLFGPNFQGVQFALSYKQGMFIVSISIPHEIFSPVVDRLFVDLFLSFGQQISAAVLKLVPYGVFLWLIAWSFRRANNSDEGYLECDRAVTAEFVCHRRCPIFSWHLTALLDLLCQWAALNIQLKCQPFGPVIALHFSSLMIIVFACVYDSTIYAICSPDASLHWSILLHGQILRITGRLLAKEFGCYWLVTRDHTFTWEPGILDLELCSLPTDSSWFTFRPGKKVNMFLSELEHCSHANTLLISSMFHSLSASLTFQAYCSISWPKEQAIVGVIRALSYCIFYMTIIDITRIIGMRFQGFNKHNQFVVNIVDMRLNVFVNHMVLFLAAWIYYPDYSQLMHKLFLLLHIAIPRGKSLQRRCSSFLATDSVKLVY